jgi:hypothetical protein
LLFPDRESTMYCKERSSLETWGIAETFQVEYIIRSAGCNYCIYQKYTVINVASLCATRYYSSL